MFVWLVTNIGTIIVALALAAIVTLIIVKMIKDKKSGKSSCGCDCGHCGMSGQCNKSI